MFTNNSVTRWHSITHAHTQSKRSCGHTFGCIIVCMKVPKPGIGLGPGIPYFLNTPKYFVACLKDKVCII